MRFTLPMLLMALFSLNLWAADGAPEHGCAADGIAVGGYDLVSYHQDAGPVKGNREYMETLGELSYLFSSRQNLEAFRDNPEKYLPTYRGWCAATLAMGRLACPDYTNFKIEKGRLLLFELAGFTNGRSVWDSDPVEFRKRADANFRKLVK